MVHVAHVENVPLRCISFAWKLQLPHVQVQVGVQKLVRPYFGFGEETCDLCGDPCVVARSVAGLYSKCHRCKRVMCCKRCHVLLSDEWCCLRCLRDVECVLLQDSPKVLRRKELIDEQTHEAWEDLGEFEGWMDWSGSLHFEELEEVD